MQHNENANPPTFFLTLEVLIQEMQKQDQLVLVFCQCLVIATYKYISSSLITVTNNYLLIHIFDRILYSYGKFSQD